MNDVMLAGGIVTHTTETGYSYIASLIVPVFTVEPN